MSFIQVAIDVLPAKGAFRRDDRPAQFAGELVRALVANMSELVEARQTTNSEPLVAELDMTLVRILRLGFIDHICECEPD